MGEAKRRKTQDPNFGRMTLGGMKIKHHKYLNPKFYDTRLETFSALTRTLGTTKEEVLGSSAMKNLGEVELIDPTKASKLVRGGRIIGGKPLAAIVEELRPAIHPMMGELIEKSPQLGKILLIMALSGFMDEDLLEQREFLILEAASTACSEALTSDDADVAQYVRGTIKGGQSYLEPFTAMRLIDCVDVIENIGKGRVIYRDSHIAVSWNRDDLGSPGELNIAIIDPDGLWSYEKWTGYTIPLSSLKGARQAIADYKSSNSINRRGEINHRYSERLSRFLGLHVQEGYAYLKTSLRTSSDITTPHGC
ncbi:MAG TPA: hypothetical protein V6C84_16205 [Coleofasciculaceae cyanobacterium]|jgi:hypothetical protein